MPPTQMTTGPWEELLEAEPEVLASVHRMRSTAGGGREWKWRLLDAAAAFTLELRAKLTASESRVAALEEENRSMRERIKILTPAANRWSAVRAEVSRFFKLYSSDPRHEKFSPGRPDPAEMADAASDRLREVRP